MTSRTVALMKYIFMACIMSGCVSSLTPHENYTSLMEHNIGSTIDSPNVAGSAETKSLLASKALPNGNIENEYKYRGTCRTFFEYEKKSKIIVSWHYQGSEKDCVIVP
jgi:hypothetical protein